MKYTIVWNENKTEGIILSGKHKLKVAEYITSNKNDYGFGLSPVANRFRDHFGLTEKCTIQDGLVPMQPTAEMILAGKSEFYRCKDRGLTAPESVINIWMAMVQEMNK